MGGGEGGGGETIRSAAWLSFDVFLKKLNLPDDLPETDLNPPSDEGGREGETPCMQSSGKKDLQGRLVGIAS
jgi:hypothetical protein